MKQKHRLAHLLGQPLTRREALDLGLRLGPEWEGFQIAWTADGWQLFNPQWRRGFTAAELRQHFYVVQGRAREKLELDQARRDAEAADARADAAEERAEFYRKQLVAESRIGAMLGRLVHSDD